MKLKSKDKKVIIGLVFLFILSYFLIQNKFLVTGVMGKWHHCKLGETDEYCCEITSDYLDVPNFDVYDTEQDCIDGYVGSMCMPDPNTNDPSYGLPISVLMSEELDYLCTNALYNNQNYYCEIEAVVYCEDGTCRDGVCIQYDCVNGEIICSNDNTQVLRCVDHSWVVFEECPSDAPCVGGEDYFTYPAFCNYTQYYCVNTARAECALCDDEVNGYLTLEECEENIWYYCLNANKTECVKRYGGCLEGEFSFSGTDETSVKATCEGQMINVTAECIAQCNTKYSKVWEEIPRQVCYIIECEIKPTMEFIKQLMMWSLVLIVAIFVLYYFITDKKTRRKLKW